MGKSKACPACRATGHDATGDHLFLMQDNITWYCGKSEYHKEGKPYREKEGVSLETEGDTTVTMEELVAGLSPVEPSVPTGCEVDVTSTYRGIRPDVFKKYQTRATYSATGGHVPETLVHTLKDTKGNAVTDKIRTVATKAFSMKGKTGSSPLKLFGQDIMPSAKRLLIVEGELDAMSAFQMLEKYRVIVWSLPIGANKKVVIDNMVEIQKFTKGKKELYFCMDSDPVGQALTKELALIFPRSKHLVLDEYKDANEYLMNKKEASFVSAFWDAEIYKPQTVVRVSEVLGKVLEKPVRGIPYPWPTLTEATYGRRGGEGIFVGAGVKVGKSDWINEVIAHDVANGYPIAVCKYEENPSMTIKKVCGKLDKIAYHRPDVVYKDSDLLATATSLEDTLFMYPAFGPADWASTKSFIVYAVAMGCRTVVVDPLTKLTNHLDSSQTETELRMISDEIACMAQDMGFFYIFTCHLKTPMSGPTHEEGGIPKSAQFRGSRAMMENTYYMLGIQRDKSTHLTDDERNTSTFHLLEDRNFSNNCQFDVRFNPTTQEYLEPTSVF